MSGSSPATEADRAYRTALSRLNRADMSRTRLAGKLVSAGYSDAAIRQALDRLEQAGLLSDERYAAALIEAFTAAGDAVELIRRKLLTRGVPEAVADRLLTAQVRSGDGGEAALDLARRKLDSLRQLPPAARARRLMGLLARRGYAPHIAEQAVRQLVPEVDSFPD